MRGDRLIVEGIKAQCHLGVFEWEQKRPQGVWVDVELAIDTAAAGKTDDIRKAIDYTRLVAAVRERLQQQTYRLLETAAEDIARLVLEQFSTHLVKVRIKKRALKGIGFAAVEIVRFARKRHPRRAV